LNCMICRNTADKSDKCKNWTKVEHHGYIVERSIQEWTKYISSYGILRFKCKTAQMHFPLRIHHIEVRNIAILNDQESYSTGCRPILRLYVCCLLSDTCKRHFYQDAYMDLDACILLDHPCVRRYDKEESIRISIQVLPIGSPLICGNETQLSLQVKIRLILCQREHICGNRHTCAADDCWLPIYPQQKQLC